MRFYPFVFTGKERDEETGYGYFGARYMDHELMTMWLSVDPMADKYPSISPYNYCMWNPVKLVDPNGMEVDDYFSYTGKYLGSDNAKTDNVRIIDEFQWNRLSSDGTIEHTIGRAHSKSFSSAHHKMTEDSQLEVYQHYNPTQCKLFATSPVKNNGVEGMVTETVNGKSRIGIYLKENFSQLVIADHAFEIINLFVHEAKHVDNRRKKNFVFEYQNEQMALLEQFTHPSFSQCRPEFRHSITNYARKVSFLPSEIIDIWDPYVPLYGLDK
jgi:RHS repeat-associated protein